MTVTRLSLANIETELLRACGNYAASTEAPWKSSANLYRVVNSYILRLPVRVAQVAAKLFPPATRRFKLEMYKTRSTSATTGTGLMIAASSSSVYLPVDYDSTIAWYDLTSGRKFTEVTNPSAYHLDRLKRKTPGPPEAIELLDVVTDGSSNWRRQAKLYPATPSGTTPSIELTYYRLPAAMPGAVAATEYPDLDVKYHWLAVCGPAVELMAPTNPSLQLYKQQELELLTDLAYTTRVE